LPEIADDAVAAATAPVERIAERVKSAVPHASGVLEASIFAEQDGDTNVVGYDGSAPYAGWIEFGGTRGRDYVDEGRWLFPYADDATRDVVDAMEDATQREIDQTSWPTPTSTH